MISDLGNSGRGSSMMEVEHGQKIQGAKEHMQGRSSGIPAGAEARKEG
eukprot:CAMPEP_0184312690 /NCGR_PEP_ID=MMETSP1049-20130417/52052_1 /TAXON_ID=77928 /ORGANISM="Proteomonas sulcata, Strain CCMP704" /LENGTH=47 /DNA_ID= /DNA_START= /DNA_END= /DNA_ORIENTATION=